MNAVEAVLTDADLKVDSTAAAAALETAKEVFAYSARRSLSKFLSDHGLQDLPDLPSRLWNTDEAGFCIAVATKRVLATKWASEVHEHRQ